MFHMQKTADDSSRDAIGDASSEQITWQHHATTEARVHWPGSDVATASAVGLSATATAQQGALPD